MPLPCAPGKTLRVSVTASARPPGARISTSQGRGPVIQRNVACASSASQAKAIAISATMTAPAQKAIRRSQSRGETSGRRRSWRNKRRLMRICAYPARGERCHQRPVTSKVGGPVCLVEDQHQHAENDRVFAGVIDLAVPLLQPLADQPDLIDATEGLIGEA